MTALSRNKFLETLPDVVTLLLPPSLQGIQSRQPWRWLVQFHYGEPRLHYEVVKASYRNGWELGFHCEAGDKHLNRYLLDGFRRHLFEIKDTLGEQVEAEMWDRGWTKIYEVYPDAELTTDYQQKIGHRLVEIITCLHPIYVDLRSRVAEVYR
ncbi:MAG: hypothetical protein H6667_04050 [Ardenticatenaceae bacterium]|nr:hypothetical protein [Ardenticatenaceae bacterium]MCB9446099.1 hypothetical protein [Ardenticatenaceae bacterium]